MLEMIVKTCFKSIGVLVCFILITSCSPTFKIQTDDTGHGRFSDYTSFKFVNPATIPSHNFSFSEPYQKVIYDAIASELKQKGFTSVKEADLLIKVQGGTENATPTKSHNPNHNTYPYRYGYPYSYDFSRYDDISRKVTTIIIDVYDTRSDKLVWQGVATGVMGKKKEETATKLQEAITGIFNEFPSGK